ncbi:MAG: TlpA family protein disulfide reductase [Acidimicrobiia bacterium]
MNARRFRSVALGSAIGLVVALAVVWALGGFTGSSDSGSDNDASGLPKVPNLSGKSAPNDALERFDGTKVSLTAYRGKPVIVNFWAASCAPCVKEMPAYEQAHLHYGGDVTILGVQTAENADDGKDMIAKTAITYDTARDPQGTFAAKMGAVALPTSVWVSADGKILDIHLGALNYDELTAKTNKLFGLGSSS